MRNDAIAARLAAVRSDHFAARASWARSCGVLRQIADPDEVVDRRGKGEHPVHPAGPAMPKFAHEPYGLEPSEYFLNELPLALAHQVAGVARGAAIDRTRTIRGVLGHVRRHPEA